MNNTQLLRRAAYFFNHSQVLCHIKQFYLVAMAILPEGASGKEICFKNTFEHHL